MRGRPPLAAPSRVSASRRVSDVRWGVLKKIVAAWFATFPARAALAFVAALFANWLAF
jgi:phosphate/sulfate permease